TKLQTVRGHRRRHARPGEPIQLYTAMRTKHCRKIVDVDPICIRLWDIRIVVDPSDRRLISNMEIEGIWQAPWDIEAFAQRDGFTACEGKSATRRMGEFWLKSHTAGSDGRIDFSGVCIRWGWPQ
ncbi:MAG: hypothetical protein MUF47_00795, partial [Porphyrobacter sp.]|nr:hypothetical protein [Porphyrobacter sp.]